MALSKAKQAKFAAISLFNAASRHILKVDIYGVRIFGIQFTPKSTADILNDGKDFCKEQRENFDIRLLFKSVYVFIPRIV